MKRFKLSETGARGWFIGDFPEAVLRTKDFEVCYQENPRGWTPTHVHKEITEITLIITGRMIVRGEEFGPGDIYVLYPGEISQMEYLEDSTVVAVKTPSRPKDKHYL
jgi:hypothetical protein